MEKLRIGIVGYGNVGRAVELSLRQNPDMMAAVVLTRRDPRGIRTLTPGLMASSIEEAERYASEVDVAVLCGGSATDLPVQGPAMASIFNTVDSYDNHPRIPEYFAAVDSAARRGRRTAIVSTGWDPGLFSLIRLLEEAVLPEGTDYTFWGPGVSQGHSDAVRRVEGVRDARQYTIPIEDTVARVRSGEAPSLSTRERHLRRCYVVAEEGADPGEIREKIRSMPNYFADYDTKVSFISQEEMERSHNRMPHGGFVMRAGKTADGTGHVLEFRLKLDSNPAFTASVLLAYARAAYRLHQEGAIGARTVFDVPPAHLLPKTPEEIRRSML